VNQDNLVSLAGQEDQSQIQMKNQKCPLCHPIRVVLKGGVNQDNLANQVDLHQTLKCCKNYSRSHPIQVV